MIRPMLKLAFAACAAVFATAVPAQETTLKVVSAFAENTEYVKKLEGMIRKLNS